MLVTTAIVEFGRHNTDFGFDIPGALSQCSLMAPPSRIVVPGYPHHATQRAVRLMDVFHSDVDRGEQNVCHAWLKSSRDRI